MTIQKRKQAVSKFERPVLVRCIHEWRGGEPLTPLFHEEVGWSAECIVRVLIHCRSRILRWSRQICRNLISVEVAMNRMEWQIASRLAPSLRRRARIAVWSMDHLSVWTSRRLAHRAAVSHYGSIARHFMRTLATHDRSRRRASGDK